MSFLYNVNGKLRKEKLAGISIIFGSVIFLSFVIALHFFIPAALIMLFTASAILSVAIGVILMGYSYYKDGINKFDSNNYTLIKNLPDHSRNKNRILECDEKLYYVKEPKSKNKGKIEAEMLTEVIFGPLVRFLMGENYAPDYGLFFERKTKEIKIRSEIIPRMSELSDIYKDKRFNISAKHYVKYPEYYVFSCDLYKNFTVNYAKALAISWLIYRDDVHNHNFGYLFEKNKAYITLYDYGYSKQLLRKYYLLADFPRLTLFSYFFLRYSEYGGRKETILNKEFIKEFSHTIKSVEEEDVRKYIVEGINKIIDSGLYEYSNIKKIFGYKKSADIIEIFISRVMQSREQMFDMVIHLKLEMAVMNKDIDSFRTNIKLLSNGYDLPPPMKFNGICEEENNKYNLSKNSKRGYSCPVYYLLLQNENNERFKDQSQYGYGFDSLYRAYHRERSAEFEQAYEEIFAERESELYRSLEQKLKLCEVGLRTRFSSKEKDKLLSL